MRTCRLVIGIVDALLAGTGCAAGNMRLELSKLKSDTPFCVDTQHEDVRWASNGIEFIVTANPHHFGGIFSEPHPSWLATSTVVAKGYLRPPHNGQLILLTRNGRETLAIESVETTPRSLTIHAHNDAMEALCAVPGPPAKDFPATQQHADALLMQKVKLRY
jgi:hypothetical protein